MKNKKNNYTLGLDIGGTNMRAILFDGEKIIDENILNTPKTDLRHFLIMLQALISPLVEIAKKEKKEIIGAGISIAGVLDSKSQTMLESPNISILDNVNLAKKIGDKIKLPVKLNNDANCFLRAEVKLGAGKKYKNAIGIIIGTGIGGAWYVNDGFYQGANGVAVEPGQMILDIENKKELEKDIYQKLTSNNPADLAERAFRGDDLAIKTFKELGGYLGIAFANIVNLMDPEIIILGGGVAESSELFLNETQKTMKKYIMSSEARKNIKLVKNKLGPNAGAIGAALLV